MTNHVQIFFNPVLGELKGLIKDGEPWFLAGDVCRGLGIKDSAQAVRIIENNYKNAGLKVAFSKRTLIETKGGKQQVVIIPEPMLYELIFNSRKKKAIIFRAWVTNEVLPALRKHGEYRTDGKIIRKKETDSIKLLVDYATASGSKSANRYYVAVTSMTNKLLGVEPNSRDSLSADQLQQVAILEGVVDIAIRDGVKAEMPYKDIYQLAKERASHVVQAIGVIGVMYD